MRLLNLCSGTGSVSKSFVGWDIVEVDWDNRYEPTHHVDLMTWECPYEVGYFDVIWASPDCTQYSIARALSKPNLARETEAARRDIISSL